jgi:response regulator of citrate/malate metabolism
VSKSEYIKPEKDLTKKGWDKIENLSGSIDDLTEATFSELPVPVQRVRKSVDTIIYAKLKEQKSVTIPYVVEHLEIPETTARRALKRLVKSQKIKSRYEMRKLDDGVFHKHRVFYA